MGMYWNIADNVILGLRENGAYCQNVNFHNEDMGKDIGTERDNYMIKGSFLEKLRVTDGSILTSPEILKSSQHVP